MPSINNFRILFSCWLLAVIWLAPVLEAATPPGSDLVLWLDAADVDGDGQSDSTANGTEVTLWTDKSGLVNDATATGNLTYDTTGLNGKPAVTFNGSSYFTTASGGESLHDAFTMFVVYENDGLNQYDTAVEWGNEAVGQRRGMMRWPSNGGILTFNGYAADVNSASPVAANKNYIAVITKATGLNGLITVYNNGIQVASGTAPLNDFVSAAIKIGANNDGNEQWNGHIAEVLIYSRDLSAQELNQAGIYLKTKYGVAADYADPRWVQQPQNLMAYAGEAHSLVGTAIGDEPLGYQWYKNGSLLDGATSTSLDFPSLQAPNAGSYFLVASNLSGMITSRVARVVVRTPADGGLLARWTFDDGTARDVYGVADGTLFGTAKIVNGRLRLTGSSGANRMEAPLGAPLGVNKTLVAWFTLSSLSPKNTAGGPLAVQDASGNFDSITYGERTPGQWMSGSDNFRRTPVNNGGAAETLVEPAEILMAITYDETAANKIKLYRNGFLYAEHNQGSLQSFTDGMAVIGPRLVPHGYMNGYVNEARIYDRALSPVEVAALAGIRLIITSQPDSQIEFVGQTATFTVGAAGDEPLSFQWLKNGVPIAGQTAASLVLANIQLSAAGDYVVVVSNPSGSVTSVVAQVAVSLPRSPVTSDLTLWLDATDVDGDGTPDTTADGTEVTLWIDKSGLGNDATATGILTYDTTGLNGRPAVTFDGSAYFTTASGGERLNDAFTMFVVFENDGLNQYDTSVEWGNEAGGQRRGMMRWPNNGGILTFNGYAADVNSASPVAADQNYIAVITKATKLNGLITVYNNGTQVASGTAPLNDFVSAAIKIGANNDGNEQWNGHIAEVLIYSRKLSAQELNETGIYLRLKYGVTSAYVVPPILTIARTGNAVNISWTAPGSWILESANALPASSWTAVPGVVNKSVSVPASVASRFYRLRQP